MKVRNLKLDHYITLLRDNEHFSFVRFGNGEWDCILGTRDITGSGSQRLDITALRKGMAAAVAKRYNYYMGMQSRSYLSRVRLLPKIERWLKSFAPDVKWCEGEVFTKPSMKGQFNPLIKELRKKRMAVVGPTWLRELSPKVFEYEAFVGVTPRNCFKDYATIKERIKRIPKGTVVSFSAGPAAKLLISELHDPERWTLIDFGSVWDPYCGKCTRRYHARLDKKVIARNLEA